MIRARHTFSGQLVAGLFAGPLLGRAFREVRFIGEVVDEGLPILMLSNHFCWWDGFIQYRLNQARLRRRLYVMMLEEQLAKHPILAQCGCFSVKRNSRSILESLDYCIEVMRSPANMLLIFPQGAIRSIHIDTPAFLPGTRYLLDRIGGDYRILLNVNLPDYGSGKKPYLNCYQEMLCGPDAARGNSLCKEWKVFYAACKKRQITER